MVHWDTTSKLPFNSTVSFIFEVVTHVIALCPHSFLIAVISVSSFEPASCHAADYPSFDKVTDGYKKVEPPSDEPRSMYTVYVKEKEGQVLIELPKNFSTKKYFFGLTVASGQRFLRAYKLNDYYVQWREYNKRLALIAPNMSIRSGGDKESQDSVSRLFTGRVLVDLPILTLSPRGGPVIDGDSLLVGSASTFFGPDGRSKNPRLAKIVKSKVFPKNIEMAFETTELIGYLANSVLLDQ